MRKTALVTFLVVALLASCGGEDLPLKRSDDPGEPPPLELPPPEQALPAFLAYSETPLEQETVASLADVRDVAVATTASIGQIEVTGPEGQAQVRVAAVDPLEFRSVAPESSKQAPFVWTELSSGEAVLTFAAADAFGLGEQTSITVGDTQLVVGAFADNGVPNIADVLVNEQVGRDLGLVDDQWLMIGARPGADLDDLRARIEEALPDARVAGLLPETPELLEPDDPEAVGEASGSLIGTMEFKILEDGFIKPEREWVRQNIATAEVSILGEVTCHRLLIPQLQAALNEIVEQGLADLIRPDDYGGCYVPRFIDRDPSLPLSMHAFGLAVDINVSTNLLGTEGDQDPRVVAIFEKWGFEWGGRWERPDPMHFELARIIEP